MRLNSEFNENDYVEYCEKIYQIKMAGITRSVIVRNGEKLTVSHKQLKLIGKQLLLKWE
jgi:hypothetical protein